VENPQYQDQRQKSLADLNNGMIDVPIIGLINDFNRLPFCFTLQSCYGHFVYNGQNDSHIEKIRNEFFVQLQELLQKQQGSDPSGEQIHSSLAPNLSELIFGLVRHPIYLSDRDSSGSFFAGSFRLLASV